MKSFGSIRRIDCVEAEVVLACGAYLTFRLDATSLSLRNLIEVKRYRMCMQPRQSILVDAYVLQKAKRAAFDAILAHRSRMYIRMPKPVGFKTSFQLKLKL